MKSEKSRSIAFLLSTFLGALGIHRFYVGKGSSAVTMLILSVIVIGLPVTAVWNLIDWITIMIGKFKDEEGKYLTKW